MTPLLALHFLPSLQVKVATYLIFTVAARDITTQKNGLVALFWPEASFKVRNRTFFVKFNEAWEAHALTLSM